MAALAASIRVLLALLSSQGLAGLPARRGATVGWPEARAWQQPRALSAEECARVRSLTGLATEGLVSSNPGAEQQPLTRGRQWPGGGHVGGAPPAELRSTQLTWLAPSAQTAWLYDRLLAAARAANEEANWQYERLNALQNLQLGLYDAGASTPGHYDWHVDQEWAPAAERLPPAKVRILSLSVQLSQEEAYSGADLQIGLVNATREQGSVLVFPSFQLHKVYPATRGQRHSLVGWVMGSDTRRYWTHCIAIHEYLLGKAHQGAEVRAATGYAGAGHGRFPDQMVYASLQTLNNAMVLQQNWSQVMSLSERQIVLAEAIHRGTTVLADVAPGTPTTFAGESLAIALVRYGLAVLATSQLVARHPAPPMIEQARKRCDRAAHLMADRSTALYCRAHWEYAGGDALRSIQTRHEWWGVRLGLPHSLWLFVTTSSAWALIIVAWWWWSSRATGQRREGKVKRR